MIATRPPLNGIGPGCRGHPGPSLWPAAARAYRADTFAGRWNRNGGIGGAGSA